MRIVSHLRQQRVPFETIVHPPVFSAQKRAKYLHVPGRQVAKNVLLAGPEDYFLAVLPATHHIDLDVLAAALKGGVRLAELGELAELFNDCEWGAVPPMGSLYGLPTVMDQAFDANSTLVLPGHTLSEAIAMNCRDFEIAERPLRLRFAVPGPCHRGEKVFSAW